jgi:hypothetical protein
MKTYWFDLVCLEPPLHAIPGLQMYVTVKGGQEVSTLEGKAVRVGHQALSATELEGYVIRLKAELDEIIAEARRRDASYHERLRAARKGDGAE